MKHLYVILDEKAFKKRRKYEAIMKTRSESNAINTKIAVHIAVHGGWKGWRMALLPFFCLGWLSMAI